MTSINFNGSSRLAAQPIGNTSMPIDLRSHQQEISNLAQGFIFRPGEAEEHFKKHQNDSLLAEANINTVEAYNAAAQVNIVKSIFEKGFVIRTNQGQRVAFFTADKTGFPEKMTAVGTFGGAGTLTTFFPANGKTPFLTIKNFGGDRAYIAYFDQGVSEKGWQRVEYAPYGVIRPIANETPQKDLDEPINFLKFSSIAPPLPES